MLKLRTDQVADLAFMIGKKRSLNLNDPGTGKTPPCVVNMKRRLDEGLKTCWVQPKALIDKNIEEIKRWTGLTDRDIGVLDGTKAKMQKELAKDPGILLVGPTRLKLAYEVIHEAGFRALDVDEFHMAFAGATSARTAAFFELSKFMEESVYMTGTLINGRLDTAFPAIHSIEPRYYPFGYDQFLGMHAYLDEYDRPVAWHNHNRLRSIVGDLGIRRTFESIYGKQEVVAETQWVSMHPKQRKLFDTFRDQAFLELENFFVDGTLPGVAMTRGFQLMEHPNHFPDLTDPTGSRFVDIMPGERPAKLDALEIHFEDHNRLETPVLVFAGYIPQQQQIAALAVSMGRRPVVMNGNCSRAQKRAADEGFRSGEYDTMIATHAVASVGFNWQFLGPQRQELDHVINASLGYMDGDYVQGYRRAIREKRQKPLRVTTLGYYDSLDLRKMQIIERKSLDAHKVDPTRELIKFNTHTEGPITH